MINPIGPIRLFTPATAAVTAITFFLLFIKSAGAADVKIQEFWAPVIFQAAASDADFITLADYDGDWIGNNNWQNFGNHPLPAYIYYDVRETKTHWFIFYSLFHPRDYTPEPDCATGCHENDLESVQLTVRKDGTETGRLEILETLAHNDIHLYTNDNNITGGILKPRGPISLVNRKPAVYVEQYGHGIYGGKTDSMMANPVIMKTVKYVFKGKAEEPDGIPDKEAGYDLLPIRETMWKHIDCIGDGKCFDGEFDYKGARLPGTFDGDDYGIDNANLPWSYYQATGGDVVAGDWFFDPAKAVLFHAGPIPSFATEYTLNPYIEDLKRLKESKTGN